MQPHAHGAPRAREGHNGSDTITPDALHRAFGLWKEYQEAIDHAQAEKKALIATFRNRCGREAAESVKTALNLMLLDPVKRAERMRFSAEAVRYVAVLEREIEEYGDD